MKIEIINPPRQDPIKTYFVQDLSMFDFQEWKDLSEIVIGLNQFLSTIASLDSKDSETNEPIANSQEVDFYLPDPIKNRAISQFMESGAGTEEPSEPVLKSSTILFAVVSEILQNHHPHSDYKVKISDG